MTLPKRLTKDRERRPEGVNGSQLKSLLKWPLSQTTLQTPKPTSEMPSSQPSGMTTEHSRTITTAENQEHDRNSPKPENQALHFNQNEARSQCKIT